VRYSTIRFEAAHGRKPKGYGVWFFLLRSRDGTETTLPESGKYGDAKRKALRGLSPMKIKSVEVLP
jgi:hypothetical protein